MSDGWSAQRKLALEAVPAAAAQPKQEHGAMGFMHRKMEQQQSVKDLSAAGAGVGAKQKPEEAAAAAAAPPPPPAAAPAKGPSGQEYLEQSVMQGKLIQGELEREQFKEQRLLAVQEKAVLQTQFNALLADKQEIEKRALDAEAERLKLAKSLVDLQVEGTALVALRPLRPTPRRPKSIRW